MMFKQAIERELHRLSCTLSLSKSWTLLEAWVAATAIAEMIGFVFVFIVSMAMNRLGNPETVTVLHIVGLAQGIVLGFAQWLVLRRYIKRVGKWIAVTTIAIVVAWLLGIQAIILLSLSLALDHAGTVETRILAARGTLLLGAWVGSILGLAQGLVLRRHIRQIGWWIFANALAWACGLLVAFVGTTLMTFDRFNFFTVLAAAVNGLTVGAVVGGITGIALLWLLKPRLSKRD